MESSVCGRRRSSSWCTAIALILGAPSLGHAQDLADFRIFQGGLTLPIFLASPPGEPERIIIAQLNGAMRVIENGALLPTPFLDIGQRMRPAHGLIGVAFPPDYATTRRFYLNYTPLETAEPRISRFTTSADPNVANTTEEILLHTSRGGGDHNAGWMDFGPDGYLYIARGDVGGMPQNPDHLAGKLLRIDVSPAKGYAIPPDNPYVGIDGRDEVVAVGLRNPWRNGFDPLTGDLYVADVGADSFEEINYVPAGTILGRNFGWRCMEGLQCRNGVPGCVCPSPSLTMPIHTYPTTGGAAVVGGTVYRGDAIPRWRGRYFFSDAIRARISSFRVVNGTCVDLQNHVADLNEGLPPGEIPGGGAIAFGTDAAGELYVLDGIRVLKIVPEFAAADWDLDGAVNTADFFAFVLDFFEGDADLTGDHVTTAADFFEYLDYFFRD